MTTGTTFDEQEKKNNLMCYIHYHHSKETSIQETDITVASEKALLLLCYQFNTGKATIDTATVDSQNALNIMKRCYKAFNSEKKIICLTMMNRLLDAITLVCRFDHDGERLHSLSLHPIEQVPSRNMINLDTHIHQTVKLTLKNMIETILFHSTRVVINLTSEVDSDAETEPLENPEIENITVTKVETDNDDDYSKEIINEMVMQQRTNKHDKFMEDVRNGLDKIRTSRLIKTYGSVQSFEEWKLKSKVVRKLFPDLSQDEMNKIYANSDSEDDKDDLDVATPIKKRARCL